jgi:PIN domain
MTGTFATVYLFPDTNVLMHFTMFDEVDWHTIAEAAHATLVLAYQVSKELDDKKYDQLAWRQERARALTRKINTILDGTSVDEPADLRAGVQIQYTLSAPDTDWKALGLDPGSGDDRLIESILRFKREHSDARVIYLSNDGGARRKAQHFGIECLDPEGYITRLIVSSPEDKEKKQLQEQLKRLTNRMPELALQFRGVQGQEHTLSCDLSPTKTEWPSDSEIAEALAKEKADIENNIRIAPFQVAQAKQSRFQSPSFGIYEFGSVSEYERDARKYLVAFEAFVPAQRATRYGSKLRLCFLLKNSGTAPANDIRVLVRLPPGCLLCPMPDDDDDFDIVHERLMLGDDGLELPSRPNPPWVQAMRMNLAPILPTHYPPPPANWGPDSPDNDWTVAEYGCSTVYSQDAWEMPCIRAWIHPELSAGCEVQYTIHARELAEPVKGRLILKSDSPRPT